MLKVIETFSGIGSQAKALEREKIVHKIVATVDWDINAIIAYDLIHNGKQNIGELNHLKKDDIIKELEKYHLSGNGKEPLKENGLAHLSITVLRSLLAAINRCNNLVSVTDVHAQNFPDDIDVLTYSFPCQDLSICGAWHGNHSGIDRNAHNRSGMLWEIERLLKEYVAIDKQLPHFLLMENVSNILSATHLKNFQEWQKYLNDIGYENQIYKLNALNFGIPQRRERTFMLSVLCNSNREEIRSYLERHNLERIKKELSPLSNYLRTNYDNTKYRYEADISNPNYTPSRQKIHAENEMIFVDGKCVAPYIKTITTKQDRNPNSGLIEYKLNQEKAPYRNLTPRECFLLMGFDETDFQALMDNELFNGKTRVFFSREKLIKMAGNSIVVNVLQDVFKQIVDIKTTFPY